MHIPAISLMFVRVRKVVSNSHHIPGLTDYVVFSLFPGSLSGCPNSNFNSMFERSLLNSSMLKLMLYHIENFFNELNFNIILIWPRW